MYKRTVHVLGITFRKQPRFSVTSSSLGRFSKSTSRLVAGEHEREEHFRSTQTLPRNLHSGQSVRSQVTMTTTSRRRDHQHHANVGRHGAPGKAGQHGSMINISIKNTVTSSPKVAAYNTLQPPPKPGRTYRSSLSRSKSFNVEADKNGVDATPSMRAPYISNLHLNRLNETPPLKSPGILASISRSNRDLFRDNKYWLNTDTTREYLEYIGNDEAHRPSWVLLSKRMYAEPIFCPKREWRICALQSACGVKLPVWSNKLMDIFLLLPFLCVLRSIIYVSQRASYKQSQCRQNNETMTKKFTFQTRFDHFLVI